VAAITAMSLWSASHAVFASSLQKMFFGESEAYDTYLERVSEFGTEEINVFAFEDTDPFSEPSLQRLRRIVDELEELEEVERAYSLLNTQEIRGDSRTMDVRGYAQQVEEDQSRAERVRAAILADEFAAGAVLSFDGNATAVVVEMVPDGSRPAEVLPLLRLNILQAFAAEGIVDRDLKCAGLLVNINASVEATNYSIQRIFPFVALLLLIIVWLMFRRLWPALMSGGVSLIAVVWTFGFAVMLDPEVNVMISLVPAVILVVGFSDVVHLCSAYLLELEEGDSKEAAILRSAEDVGRACVFTSMTTFVGFVCLSFVPTPMFRIMGVVLGVGVAVALILAMTLVPIFFSWMERPLPLRSGTTSKVQSVLDSVLDWCRSISVNHPWRVIVAFGLVAAASIAGMAQLQFEADFAKRLNADSDIRQDLDWFGEEFSGTSGLDVIVTVPERDGLLDPDRFRQIANFQRQLEELPEVESALSLVDLMERLYAAYTPERAAEDPLPNTRAAFAQLLELFQSGDGQDLERLVDFRRQTMRISLRMAEDGVTSHSRAGEQILALAAQEMNGAVEVEVSGLLYLLGDWVIEILDGQRRGLMVSFLVITLMMWVALGAPKPAILSMGPNLFPLLVILGVVGGTWDYVDSDTLIIALLAIGIGVDDTIHFLVRLKVEQERTNDTELALERTFTFAGRAILMTSIILGFGFLPFLTSDYYSTRMMGTLLPTCLLVAVLADLLLVPAMAKVGWLDLRRRKNSSSDSAAGLPS
jgi:predicted RND superfamily exporter protein